MFQLCKYVCSFLCSHPIKCYLHSSVFKNFKSAQNFFTKVDKMANNFWQNNATVKLRTYLESWNIENFENVCAIILSKVINLQRSVQFFNPHSVASRGWRIVEPTEQHTWHLNREINREVQVGVQVNRRLFLPFANDILIRNSRGKCESKIALNELRFPFPSTRCFNQHFQVSVHFPLTSDTDQSQQHRNKFLRMSRIEQGAAWWEAKILLSQNFYLAFWLV